VLLRYSTFSVFYEIRPPLIRRVFKVKILKFLNTNYTNLYSLTNPGNISSILKVRLGEYDVSVTTEALPYEELDVANVLVHPQFNNLSLANDIALLRFVRPARRRPHIDVACMPHPGQVNEAEGTRCVVTGWGRRLEGMVL